MIRRAFGKSGDGSAVEEIILQSSALRVSVIGYGAAIRDLRPRGGPMNGRPLVLGLQTLADYEAYSPHFGAIAGRCANRIAGACFRLAGRTIRLDRNTADGNHLHGGTAGFGRRVWEVVAAEGNSATFALTSGDGDQGYPGEVTARVTYRLEDATVITEIQATTDQPTPVNLAQHSYFNLAGSGDILSHRLMISADAITPTDASLVPTGAIREVAGTPFDFRALRPVRPSGLDAVTYDVNYCLSEGRRTRPAYAATLVSDASGVRLDLWTTEPGLQFYDGGTIDIPVTGLDGRQYGPYSGLCLEPQGWPDAPNQRRFPSVILRPGDTYRQCTEFRFSW